MSPIQDGDGGVVEAFEEPGQDLCEGDDADDGAGTDDCETDYIALVYGSEHELVFAEENEDE